LRRSAAVEGTWSSVKTTSRARRATMESSGLRGTAMTEMISFRHTLTDRLLDLKPGHIYEHAKDEIVLPSGVCRKGSPHYSKARFVSNGDADISAYTAVLTKFYAAHPEYQEIPFEYLMQYLTDEQNKTADDLYKMAKYGEMRTDW
jgi:hypothetical protein